MGMVPPGAPVSTGPESQLVDGSSEPGNAAAAPAASMDEVKQADPQLFVRLSDLRASVPKAQFLSDFDALVRRASAGGADAAAAVSPALSRLLFLQFVAHDDNISWPPIEDVPVDSKIFQWVAELVDECNQQVPILLRNSFHSITHSDGLADAPGAAEAVSGAADGPTMEQQAHLVMDVAESFRDMVVQVAANPVWFFGAMVTGQMRRLSPVGNDLVSRLKSFIAWWSAYPEATAVTIASQFQALVIHATRSIANSAPLVDFSSLVDYEPAQFDTSDIADISVARLFQRLVNLALAVSRFNRDSIETEMLFKFVRRVKVEAIQQAADEDQIHGLKRRIAIWLLDGTRSTEWLNKIIYNAAFGQLHVHNDKFLDVPGPILPAAPMQPILTLPTATSADDRLDRFLSIGFSGGRDHVLSMFRSRLVPAITEHILPAQHSDADRHYVTVIAAACLLSIDTLFRASTHGPLDTFLVQSLSSFMNWWLCHPTAPGLDAMLEYEQRVVTVLNPRVFISAENYANSRHLVGTEAGLHHDTIVLVARSLAFLCVRSINGGNALAKLIGGRGDFLNKISNLYSEINHANTFVGLDGRELVGADVPAQRSEAVKGLSRKLLDWFYPLNIRSEVLESQYEQAKNYIIQKTTPLQVGVESNEYETLAAAPRYGAQVGPVRVIPRSYEPFAPRVAPGLQPGGR